MAKEVEKVRIRKVDNGWIIHVTGEDDDPPGMEDDGEFEDVMIATTYEDVLEILRPLSWGIL